MPELNRKPFSSPSVKAMNASLALFLALLVAFVFHLFDTRSLSRGVALAIMTAMLALALALFGWSILLQRKEKPLINEEAIRRHADLLGAFRWGLMLFQALIVFSLAPFVQWSMIHGLDPPKWLELLPTIFFFAGLQSQFKIMAGGVMGRGIDDELTELHRAQAWRAGLRVTLIAVSLSYILSYIHDYSWLSVPLSASIPYALALGSSASALKFLWLERKSAKDG